MKTYAKDHNMGFEKVMTLFFLERAAFKLSHLRSLEEKIIFKGGFVNVRVHASPRYTTDLDASIKGVSLEQVEKPIIDCIELDVGDGVWFRYDKSSPLKTQKEDGGLRIQFRAGLGEVPRRVSIAQLVHIDTGSDCVDEPKPLFLKTTLAIGEGHISWHVYPVELTVAEKIHALISKGSLNSRAKDIFDLDLLIPKCDLEKLKTSVLNTFKSRGTPLSTSVYEHLSEINPGILRKGWLSVVAGMEIVQEFDVVFERVLERCKEFSF
jgi:hypothetical protein